jgi:hypothetical protein
MTGSCEQCNEIPSSIKYIGYLVKLSNSYLFRKRRLPLSNLSGIWSLTHSYLQFYFDNCRVTRQFLNMCIGGQSSSFISRSWRGVEVRRNSVIYSVVLKVHKRGDSLNHWGQSLYDSHICMKDIRRLTRGPADSSADQLLDSKKWAALGKGIYKRCNFCATACNLTLNSSAKRLFPLFSHFISWSAT